MLRYLLETCETTEQAEAALARLPIAMAYNVTMIDAHGTVRTAHLRPGHDAEFAGQPAATNHRWEQPVDVAHATYYRSVERVEQLKDLVADRATADELATSCSPTAARE